MLAKEPDILTVENKERVGVIIDIDVPADVDVGEKEKENIENY